ncbi:hypothetical protein C8R44DRAFT_920076 [Mycena epipterygia]|nr:hypothetical protein C8R44DRAFT_920076 [Mycena epipterygia]
MLEIQHEVLYHYDQVFRKFIGHLVQYGPKLNSHNVPSLCLGFSKQKPDHSDSIWTTSLTLNVLMSFLFDSKGHRKPFGDIGHNWVADTGVKDYNEPVSFLVGSGRINPRAIEGNRMSDRVRIQSVGITRGNSEVKPSQESIYVINATLRRIKERRGVVTCQERRGVVVMCKDGSELPRVPIGFAIVDGVSSIPIRFAIADGVSCGRVTVGLIQATELNHDICQNFRCWSVLKIATAIISRGMSIYYGSRIVRMKRDVADQPRCFSWIMTPPDDHQNQIQTEMVPPGKVQGGLPKYGLIRTRIRIRTGSSARTKTAPGMCNFINSFLRVFPAMDIILQLRLYCVLQKDSLKPPPKWKHQTRGEEADGNQIDGMSKQTGPRRYRSGYEVSRMIQMSRDAFRQCQTQIPCRGMKIWSRGGDPSQIYLEWRKSSKIPTAHTPRQLRENCDEIKSAILRHKACIAALEERQRETEEELTLVLYPVLTLPNEIVSRIFVECLPNHGRVRPSRRRAPLLLAQICHHWRNIALSTCQLWSSVDIDTGFDLRGQIMEYASNAVLAILKTWFFRARTCPLSLTIRSSYSSSLRIPVSILLIIPAVAGQLRRLELSLCSEDLQSLKQLRISLPRLECLAMDSGTRTSSSELRPISIFPETPSLRNLSMHCRGIGISIPDLDLYPNVTRLELSHVSLGFILQILDCRPQLIHLAAHLGEFASPTPVSQTAVHLQSLVLSGDPQNVLSALNCLTLPHLLRLELHISFGLGPSCLLSFFRRSTCPLDHLTLGFNYTRILKECSSAIPSLTSLEVKVNRYSMVHFRELLDAHALLPRLRTLSMRVDSEKFDYPALAKALRARRSRTDAQHVEFVQIHLHKDPYADDDEDDQCLPRRAVDEFTRLIAEGLQIRVIWGSEEGWPERWVAQSLTALRLIQKEYITIKLFLPQYCLLNPRLLACEIVYTSRVIHKNVRCAGNTGL